jgi:nicotinate phosphoribosyltransferase
MPAALLTDLYELHMAACYLRHGLDAPATFSLFVRRLPPTRGYLVAAGLDDALGFLEDHSFTRDDRDYLVDALGFDAETATRLAAVRFLGDVWAVPEGTVVFADEPLLEVTAPIAQAQLVETAMLNILTFQTTIASKAARVRTAAGGREVVDFAFRRTQGLETGIQAVRAMAVAGVRSTSNVAAARRYGLRASGTMAHSFVQALPSELDAFRCFAADHPDTTTFLVDTYATLAGVDHAIEVIHELGLADRSGAHLAVRLDSGDLDGLARAARARLDGAGLPAVRIVASGGLDELAIDDLVRAGAPIDVFGVGTQMGISSDAPSLDSAYKLVEYDGRPVMKLSPGKEHAPGAKQIHRRPRFGGDLLAGRHEAAPAGTFPLLRPVMRGGRRVADPERLEALSARLDAQLAILPEPVMDLRNPVPLAVDRSPALRHVTGELREQYRRACSV